MEMGNSYLPNKSGLMPALREKDMLAAGEDCFPKTELKILKTGDLSYVVFDLPDEAHNEKGDRWGYLGEAIEISESEVTFRFANAHTVVGSKDNNIGVERVPLDTSEPVFIVKKAAQAPQVPSKPPSEEEIETALEKVQTWARLDTEKWCDRRNILRSVMPEAARLERVEPLTDKRALILITEAWVAAKDKAEAAAVNEDGDKPADIGMGVSAANVKIIVEAVNKLPSMLESAAQACKKLENATIAEKLAELLSLTKTIMLNQTTGHHQEQAVNAQETTAGMISMKKDGKCAYHACGAALAIHGGASPSKIGRENKDRVDIAKQHIVQNVCKMTEKHKDFVVGKDTDERTKRVEQEWTFLIRAPRSF